MLVEIKSDYVTVGDIKTKQTKIVVGDQGEIEYNKHNSRIVIYNKLFEMIPEGISRMKFESHGVTIKVPDKSLACAKIAFKATEDIGVCEKIRLK